MHVYKYVHKYVYRYIHINIYTIICTGVHGKREVVASNPARANFLYGIEKL